MSKKYNELTVLKRLVNIQKIYDLIQNKQNANSFSVADKIAYILWQYPFSRNSDIELSIIFYKLYFPQYVINNAIKLDDFFNLPKMYDIQRTRAEIQNTEGLFPATEEVQKMRKKRAKELQKYYKDKKGKH